MALFNETLAGRWNDIIRRIHALKQTPAPQVSPEIVHDITLESDRVEWMVLHGGIIWAGQQSIVANPGTFSGAGVRNPSGSGLLLVVTMVEVANTGLAASAYQLRTRAQGVIQSASTSFFRDSRRGFVGNSPAIILGDNANFASQPGAGPLELLQMSTAEGTRAFNSTPYVLSPGFELLVTNNIANAAVSVSLAGYGRHILPEELNIL